ncbi:MAG: cupin domain-containing protein [Polyangiaceae bacterium]|nr:cupin domain-containing protein [Polyangiaceae bacterium]
MWIQDLPRAARCIFLGLPLFVLACSGAEPAPPVVAAPAPGFASAAASAAAPGSASAAASAAAPGSASAAAAAPPTPIDGALPAISGLPDFELSMACAQEPCRVGDLVPPGSRQAAGAPIAVYEVALERGGAAEFPFNEAVDVTGVVVEGSASVAPVEEPARALAGLGQWRAFRARGGGVRVGAEGKGKARVLLAFARIPAGSPLAEGLPGAGGARPAVKVSDIRRARPVESIDFSKLPDLAWGGGAYHARIGWDAAPDAGDAAVVDTLVFSKDAAVAEHVHDKEWECLAVLRGAGELVVKPAGGEERRALRPGSIACVPVGTRHAWRPRGTEPLVAIQVFGPSGPEQRFRKLAAAPPPIQ